MHLNKKVLQVEDRYDKIIFFDRNPTKYAKIFPQIIVIIRRN
jgi:hypothetical protein